MLFLLILYVDEYKRVCYFIIAKIIIDYKKQILITKIKKKLIVFNM